MPGGGWQIRKVDKCCGCVTDLKTAAAIIAVLGVVTSPAVSWAFVRHSFVIRMSCYVTYGETRPDIVDIRLNNILSFGFGANAGLGPSCLGPIPTPKNNTNTNTTSLLALRRGDSRMESGSGSGFVSTVKWIGWAVLLADFVFIGFSIHFLYKIFRPPGTAKAATRFMISCMVALLLSFVYGMLYVIACIVVGGAFPVFEFLFCIIDVLLWTYFLIVVHSYRRTTT